MDRGVICEKAITVCLVVILVLLAVIFVVKFLQRQNNENEEKDTNVIGLQVNWTLKNTEENEEKTGEIIMQDLDDSNDEREAIIKNTQLKEVVEIKVTDDSHEVIFTLNNSSAAKSLYN